MFYLIAAVQAAVNAVARRLARVCDLTSEKNWNEL